MTLKLQKILAMAGLGSRRTMEKWIADGRVKVNNQVATLGERASITDKILVDDEPIRLEDEMPRILLYNKPEGEVTTRSDPEGRPTVFANLPSLRSGRWISIGRLDVSTSGLLLFTNNGDLAHQLMHPSFDLEREYAARVYGTLTNEMLTNLQQGVLLEDGMANFKSILLTGGEKRNQWCKVIISEGRNREVRRLFESQGLTVSRLIRTRYGPLLLTRDCRRGQFQELSTNRVKQLITTIKKRSL